MLQAALKMIFPDQCLLCGALTDCANGLCPGCWRDTPFLLTRGCVLCGAPILGDEDGTDARCDECHADGRPWDRGASVMLYRGTARRLVMAIKHGDRLDLLPRLAAWMVPKARPLAPPGTLIVPVPIHWRRLLRRRHNQAAGLARPLAAALDCPCLPDALIRLRATPLQRKMTHEERAALQLGSVAPAPLWRDRLKDQNILLVDDVMTTGATLAACAAACYAAGAREVSVVTLARVARAP
ncbi:MAG: double zinc ribbon domain-containing protein [Rhodobacteraceae bacterium]|nr:double zinc ribbon domain-containing protein [Paracoccaceae bacterium]